MRKNEKERDLPKTEKMRAGDAPPAALAKPTPLTERYLYDPYGLVADFDRHFTDLRRNMESMLVPAWGTFGRRPLEALTVPRYARADFCDLGPEYGIDLEMPGFERQDIEIELTATEVRVEARREQDEEREQERFFAHERSYATLRRSFTFPEEVLPDKAEAKLENGVLRMRLPKKVPTPAPKSVKLKVK